MEQLKSQEEFIHDFNDRYRAKFNPELFYRDDQDIIDEITKVIMSCEKDKYFTLKVLSIEIIEDYEEIYNTLHEHHEKRKKKGSKDINPYDYIQVRDSDIILMKVTYFIQKNGIERMKIDGKDVDMPNPHQNLEVLIELPRYVDKYYFRLQGNYYIPIKQIVDGSTYNNSMTASSKYDNVSFKILFMSVRIFRMFKEFQDVNTKEKIKTIIYTSLIFKHHINALYYILAKYGLYNTLEWFHMPFIRITDTPTNELDKYCFKKYNLYITIPKELFADPVVQSVVSTIYDGINRDASMQTIFTWAYWYTNLGYCYKNNTAEKGIFVLDSLESIYDIKTREMLRLPDEKKKDIYHVLKWLATEFPLLRAKDNVDVSIKRVRLGEYVAHAYAIKLSKGIKRMTEKGNKVKLKNVVSAVYTKPDFIISQIIGMSNLVSYSDLVNDNDATQAIKFSFKGISGLGEEGGMIQPTYRFVDPSHVGILDLDTSPVSDSGMSGMICPMAKLYNGGFFTDFEEPNSWDDDFQKTVNEYYENNNIHNPIIIHGEKKEYNYDYVKDYMTNISLGKIKICPLIDHTGTIDYTKPPTQQILEQNTDMNKIVNTENLFEINEDPLMKIIPDTNYSYIPDIGGKF